MKLCDRCHQEIEGAAIRICGGRFCSMECVKASTGHERPKVEVTDAPKLGTAFDAYYDHTLGKHITSWRQQERELNRYNSDPNNKEKRSFFQDNKKAVIEAKNLYRHKHEIAREAYAKEGKKYDPTRQGDPHREKSRRIYSFNR